MSKIAEALAKAKERTGTTTAPFLTGARPPGPPGPPGVTGPGGPVDPPQPDKLRRARNKQRMWLTLLTIAAIITGFLLWKRLSEMGSPSDSPGTTSTSVAAPEATPPGPAAPSGPAASNPPPPAPGAVAVRPATQPPPPAANPSAVPRVDTYDLVNNLSITAVLPGERARLSYKGRIINVGEVIDHDLVFAGIRDGRLVFLDARGATYTRRY